MLSQKIYSRITAIHVEERKDVRLANWHLHVGTQLDGRPSKPAVFLGLFISHRNGSTALASLLTLRVSFNWSTPSATY
jgi:hypothetical protein